MPQQRKKKLVKFGFFWKDHLICHFQTDNIEHRQHIWILTTVKMLANRITLNTSLLPSPLIKNATAVGNLSLHLPAPYTYLHPQYGIIVNTLILPPAEDDIQAKCIGSQEHPVWIVRKVSVLRFRWWAAEGCCLILCCCRCGCSPTLQHQLGGTPCFPINLPIGLPSFL